MGSEAGIMADLSTLPHVVIVGAGFGGLAAARALARSAVRVTLIDRTNHHLFQPLLYQVATAGLNPAEIAAPVRAVLGRQRNLTCLMGSVTGVDTARRVVALDGRDRELPYDYLLLAVGGKTSYFGHDAWEAVAPGLKTLEDARRIRERVLMAFELAEKEADPDIRRRLLTVVVVGGGPTGVEMAGALAELARFTLVKDFRNIHPQTARVVLLEGGPRLLAAYPPDLGAYTAARLQRMGVDVRTGVKVDDIREGVVHTSVGSIEAANCVWAAGVGGHPLAGGLGVAVDRAGRAFVDADLRLPGAERVYAIGDMVHFEQPDTYGGKMVPGVSPAAIQEGKHAARNILRQIRGEAPQPFHYVDRGTMATIGRSSAVAEIHGIHLKGPIAWLAWLFIHLINLVDFENRVVVLVRWAYSYFTWQRGARLIMEPCDEKSEAWPRAGGDGTVQPLRERPVAARTTPPE